MAVAVFLHPTCQTGDCQNACQLHNPPNEQLDAEQCVSNPRADGAANEDEKRDVGVKHIAARDVCVVTANDTPLP